MLAVVWAVLAVIYLVLTRPRDEVGVATMAAQVEPVDEEESEPPPSSVAHAVTHYPRPMDKIQEAFLQDYVQNHTEAARQARLRQFANADDALQW